MSEKMDTPEIVWGHQILLYHQGKKTKLALEEFEDWIGRWNPTIVYELDDVTTIHPMNPSFKMIFREGYTIVLPILPMIWLGVRPMSLKHGETHRLVFCPRQNRVSF